MPRFIKTTEFRWLVTLMLTAVPVIYWCGCWSEWREAVTENLAEVSDKMDTVTTDMAELKVDVQWIREGNSRDVATISPVNTHGDE